MTLDILLTDTSFFQSFIIVLTPRLCAMTWRHHGSSGRWTILEQKKKKKLEKPFMAKKKHFILIKNSYNLKFFYISMTNPKNKNFKKSCHKRKRKIDMQIT